MSNLNLSPELVRILKQTMDRYLEAKKAKTSESSLEKELLRI